jgi:hypothetical protein
MPGPARQTGARCWALYAMTGGIGCHGNSFT